MVKLFNLVLMSVCMSLTMIASQAPRAALLVTPEATFRITLEDQDAIDANAHLGTIDPRGPVNGAPVLVSGFKKAHDKQKKESENVKTACAVAAVQKTVSPSSNTADKK